MSLHFVRKLQTISWFLVLACSDLLYGMGRVISFVPSSFTLFFLRLFLLGHAVEFLVEALCYKPEDRSSNPDEVIGFFFFDLPNPSSREG
jgi:hypothetical protein